MLWSKESQRKFRAKILIFSSIIFNVPTLVQTKPPTFLRSYFRQALSMCHVIVLLSWRSEALRGQQNYHVPIAI